MLIFLYRTSGPLEGVIIIAFRGTVSIKNAKTDISVGRVPFHLPGMGDSIGKVHNGFYHAFSQVRDDLMNQVALLLENKRNTSRIPGAIPVICVGHSLGGALATICAFEMAHRFKSQISLQTYTFGCPRVGDRDFAREYDRRVPFTFRFVFDR
jgi:predicted lipase